MLFVFEDSLVPRVAAGERATIDGLANVLNAVFLGYHCASVSPNVAQQLIEPNVLDARAQATLRSIASNFSQRESLWRSFSSRVFLAGDQTLPARLGPTEWRHAAAEYCNKNVREMRLLTENLTDADLLQIAAKHYAIDSRLTAISISITKQGGGGSTIAEAFRRIVDARVEFCICVTDSDLLSPACELGGVARECLNIAHDTDWISRHVSLGVRELENLFPRQVLELALDDALHDRVARVYELERLEPTISSFADMKEGIRLHWVLSLPAGSPRRMYWDAIVVAIRRAYQNALACEDGDLCPNPAACVCVVVPEVSKQMAVRVLEWLQTKSTHKSLESFQGPKRRAWLELGRQIFEMSAATKPVRV